MCKNSEAEPIGIAQEWANSVEFWRFAVSPVGPDRAFGFRRSVERLLALDVHPEIGGQLDGADAGVHREQRYEHLQGSRP